MIRLGLLLLVLPILVLLGVYFWELGDVRACQLEGGYWNYLEGACHNLLCRGCSARRCW